MYKSPLLQAPLPQSKKPLPKIWSVHRESTGIDEVRIGVEGMGTIAVPYMVEQAMRELEDHSYMGNYVNRDAFNPWRYDWQVIALLLCTRYHDMGYVECTPVKPSSATPLPPYQTDTA